MDNSFLKSQLVSLLEEKFTVLSNQHLTAPSWESIVKSNYLEEVINIYQELGGIQKSPRIQLPVSYILLENDIAIFLDETLHFNRYRLQTLRSPIYQQLPLIQVEPYKTYCRKHEKECIKAGLAGKNWTFPFAEKLFGEAAEKGDFSKNGSPSWKLRALTDFLLDVFLLSQKVKVFRLAVYQQLMLNRQLFKFGDILMSGNPSQKEAILNYIERKISS